MDRRGMLFAMGAAVVLANSLPGIGQEMPHHHRGGAAAADPECTITDAHGQTRHRPDRRQSNSIKTWR
jgi:hypothetical protein